MADVTFKLTLEEAKAVKETVQIRYSRLQTELINMSRDDAEWQNSSRTYNSLESALKKMD